MQTVNHQNLQISHNNDSTVPLRMHNLKVEYTRDMSPPLIPLTRIPMEERHLEIIGEVEDHRRLVSLERSAFSAGLNAVNLV